FVEKRPFCDRVVPACHPSAFGIKLRSRTDNKPSAHPGRPISPRRLGRRALKAPADRSEFPDRLCPAVAAGRRKAGRLPHPTGMFAPVSPWGSFATIRNGRRRFAGSLRETLPRKKR